MDVTLLVYGLLLCGIVASKDEVGARDVQTDGRNDASNDNLSHKADKVRNLEGETHRGHIKKINCFHGMGHTIKNPSKIQQRLVADDTELGSGASGYGSFESGSGSGESGSGMGSGGSELENRGKTASKQRTTVWPEIMVEKAAIKKDARSTKKPDSKLPTTEWSTVTESLHATSTYKNKQAAENATAVVIMSTAKPIHSKDRARATDVSKKSTEEAFFTQDFTDRIVPTSKVAKLSYRKSTSVAAVIATKPQNKMTKPSQNATLEIANGEKKKPTDEQFYTQDLVNAGVETIADRAQDPTMVTTEVQAGSERKAATSINTQSEFDITTPSNMKSVETFYELEDINYGRNKDGKKEDVKSQKPRVKLSFVHGIIIGVGFVVLPCAALMIFVARLLRKRAIVGVMPA